MIVLGITTCDTTRKTLAALKAAGREVQLRDVRTTPLSAAECAQLVTALGPAIINRASTTWRALDADERALDAAALLQRRPTVMKRPVIDEGGVLHAGWDRAALMALLRG